MTHLIKNFKDHLMDIHARGETQVKLLFDPDIDFDISLTKEDLRKVGTPTFIITGDRDELIDLSVPFDMRQNMPNSSLWVISNTGHIPLGTDTQEEFVRLVEDFLQNR